MPKAQMGQDLRRLAGEVIWGRKSLSQRHPWLHKTVDTLAVIPCVPAGVFQVIVQHTHAAFIPRAKLECGEAAVFWPGFLHCTYDPIEEDSQQLHEAALLLLCFTEKQRVAQTECLSVLSMWRDNIAMATLIEREAFNWGRLIVQRSSPLPSR